MKYSGDCLKLGSFISLSFPYEQPFGKNYYPLTKQSRLFENMLIL